MNKIVAFWKPKGITSYDVIRKLKRYTGNIKIGHAGTLDPFAEGILIILFGKSTKKQNDIMDLDKEYEAVIQLGKTTETLDPEGEVTEKAPVPDMNEIVLTEIMKSFVGEISQVPPLYSAIKISGKPLYKYAREGKKVNIKPRIVKIHNIELISAEKDVIRIKVCCGRGTYIRSLARDIALRMNTVGYLTELTRTRVGSFSKESAVTIERIPDWLSSVA